MKTIYVAGSINMDVVATAERYPRAGETVLGKNVFFFPGGKGANQAVSAAKLGAPVGLIGCLGEDSFGKDLSEFLFSQNIDLSNLRYLPDAPTGTALITIVDSNNSIVVVPGANGLVSESDVNRPILAKGDILVSQFEIPVATIRAFFSRGKSVEAMTILNPAPAIEFDIGLLELVDVLILNETELSFLTKHDLDEHSQESKITDAARSLQVRNDQTVCVTLGKRGALALCGDEVVVIRGRPVPAIDTTGAGDCFVGAMAARAAAGATIRASLEYANVAASLCVQRMGAGPSMPTAEEVHLVI